MIEREEAHSIARLNARNLRYSGRRKALITRWTAGFVNITLRLQMYVHEALSVTSVWVQMFSSREPIIAITLQGIEGFWCQWTRSVCTAIVEQSRRIWLGRGFSQPQGLTDSPGLLHVLIFSSAYNVSHMFCYFSKELETNSLGDGSKIVFGAAIVLFHEQESWRGTASTYFLLPPDRGNKQTTVAQQWSTLSGSF